MHRTLNLAAYWDKIAAWCSGVFWTENTFYQISIIVIATGVGIIISDLFSRPLKMAIEKARLPHQIKNIAYNLKRLIMPFMAMSIMFFSAKVASAPPLDVDAGLIVAVAKILLAWIVIRLALQFVENKFARNFFAFSILTIAALSIFGILDETSTVLDSFSITLGKSRLTALAVIKSVFLIFFLMYLALFTSSFAERRISRIKGMKKSSQVLFSKIVRITLIVFAFLIGITSAGIDLSLFAVFGGAIGLGIGFGLQKGMSNLFSGLLLLMDKSIVPGDVLEMENGTYGLVQHMGARYTEVVTLDNKSYLIPNEDFITQKVVNWSHGNTLIRLDVTFGVDYRHNPHDIIDMAAKAAAKADARICKDPEPVCNLVEFAESSLNFRVSFWILDAENGTTNVKSAVMLALWDTFQKNKIVLPYPHREITITEKKKAS